MTLTVYNLLGQEIRRLVDAEQPQGTYKITWDGRNEAGEPVASGMYFYPLEAKPIAAPEALEGTEAQFVQTRKMILMR